MKVIDAEDIVRSVREEGGEFFVSFENHDGYFQVLASPHSDIIKEKIRKVLQSKEPLNFTHDKYLNIVNVG